MKWILLGAVLAVTLSSAQSASAQASSNLVSYIVTNDNGNSYGRGFRSDRTDESEECAFDTSCVYPEISIGYSPSGLRCCRSKWAMQNAELTEKSEQDMDLENVFEPNQSLTFWGYASTTNRSPNAGRTQSAVARLDVCLGATDTDTALASQSVSSCQSYCGSTNYNDHCTSNSAAVCYDRCECALSDPNCSNL